MFTRLAKINDKTKYAVHGWLRKNQQLLQLPNIPNMITAIAVLFYAQHEIFEFYDRTNIELSRNKNSITALAHGIGQFAFGINTISSTAACKCKWDLNIIHHDGIILDIGICSISESDMESAVKSGRPGLGIFRCVYYAFDGAYKLWKNESDEGIKLEYFRGNLPALTSGDKLSINLDLIERELRFIVNGEDKGVGFKGIQHGKDIKYKLVVKLWQKGSVVEIDHFESN